MISIKVAYATLDKQIELPLAVEDTCTVKQAIERSNIFAYFPTINFLNMKVGIFGRQVTMETTLQDKDRVEIYRPLQRDPKESRKIREKRSRAR